MKRKNKYYNRSRISEAKFREIIKYFSVDLNASQIAKLTNLNLNTINKILILIRVRIFELLQENQLQSAPLVGRLKLMKAILVHAAFAASVVGVQEAKLLFLVY